MAELGGVTGHARGRVVSGQDVERVLALVPEQVWAWDDDLLMASGETVDYSPAVPMAKRREIIAQVLLADR